MEFRPNVGRNSGRNSGNNSGNKLNLSKINNSVAITNKRIHIMMNSNKVNKLSRDNVYIIDLKGNMSTNKYKSILKTNFKDKYSFQIALNDIIKTFNLLTSDISRKNDLEYVFGEKNPTNQELYKYYGILLEYGVANDNLKNFSSNIQKGGAIPLFILIPWAICAIIAGLMFAMLSGADGEGGLAALFIGTIMGIFTCPIMLAYFITKSIMGKKGINNRSNQKQNGGEFECGNVKKHENMKLFYLGTMDNENYLVYLYSEFCSRGVGILGRTYIVPKKIVIVKNIGREKILEIKNKAENEVYKYIEVINGSNSEEISEYYDNNFVPKNNNDKKIINIVKKCMILMADPNINKKIREFLTKKITLSDFKKFVKQYSRNKNSNIAYYGNTSSNNTTRNLNKN